MRLQHVTIRGGLCSVPPISNEWFPYVYKSMEESGAEFMDYKDDAALDLLEYTYEEVCGLKLR